MGFLCRFRRKRGFINLKTFVLAQNLASVPKYTFKMKSRFVSMRSVVCLDLKNGYFIKVLA